MLRALGIPAAAVLLAAGIGSVMAFDTTSSTTTSTTSTSTTTTVPYERAQPTWSVASRSARGVMVDFKNETVGTATFRVLRLRARTTLLRWHIGTLDPPAKAGLIPADAGPAIDWPSEGLAGVVAVFNGGFKKLAHAGGAVVDGVTLEPLVRGDTTIAIDAAGHWSMGVWGSASFPPPGFDAISYRQNLGPIVEHAKLNPVVNSSNWAQWGSPLNYKPLTPRTGLGVDANGNLLFVATMSPVLVASVAQALISAGAVVGMELDMNPFWPILGASMTPLHSPGVFALQLPGSEHDASVYESAWERDFFVALAEPDSWSCNWTSPGVKPGVVVAQPQRLRLVGAGCTRPTPTTTTSPITTTTTTTTTLDTSGTTTTAPVS